MAKPILNYETTYAFDSTKEHIFKFTWSNTNVQTIANILTIRDNQTNNIVYSERQDTLLLQHILPSNVLQNGRLYNVSVSIIGIDNTISDNSDSMLFYCYSQPEFNVVVDNIIQSSSCNLNVSYIQPEGEQLQCFKIELYNSYKELVYSSTLRYDVTSSVILNNLSDNTTYYIKAVGQTINHMNIESDLVCFSVNYISPSMYAYVNVENRYKFGDIQFSSNLTSVQGHSDNPVYKDNDYIDTITGADVKFDEDFNIQNNFTLVLKGYNLQYNKKILELSNTKNNLVLYVRKDNNDLMFLELNTDDRIIIFSNHIDIQNKIVKITLKYIDGYYDLSIQEEV